jgi:hypothetical protein
MLEPLERIHHLNNFVTLVQLAMPSDNELGNAFSNLQAQDNPDLLPTMASLHKWMAYQEAVKEILQKLREVGAI